ncbi:hypothetical protein [Litorivivens sp.]|uniref:hypothetical protein n=1 Tax=Litorivivens sp. TaxID=2020868 RepID=UPI003567D61B
MEIVKRTSEYTIVKKRNGRFGVQGKGRSWINAEEKVRILKDAGLIKAPEPKPAEPEEAPAEEEGAAGEENAE